MEESPTTDVAGSQATGLPSTPIAATPPESPVTAAPRRQAVPAAPGGLSLWWASCRPATLIAAPAPAVATLAYLWAARATVQWIPAALTVIALTLALAGANMLDVYLESHRSRAVSWTSPLPAVTVTERSSAAPLPLLRASIVVLAIAGCVGIPLLKNGGFALAVLGVVGLALAFLYSATTYAIKRLPVAELAVFLALGPGIVLGTVLAQQRTLAPVEVLMGCAFGLFALAAYDVKQMELALLRPALLGRALISFAGMRVVRWVVTVAIIGGYVLLAVAAPQTRAAHGLAGAFLSIPAALLALTSSMRVQAGNAVHLTMREMLRAYDALALWTIVGLLVCGALIQVLR